MKKAFLLVMCLFAFALNMSACHNNTSEQKNKYTKDKYKFENTEQIVIGHLLSSYAAIIKNQEEIKQLEDLFNQAEFTKSDTSIQQPYLTISFSGEKGSTLFCIDDNDVIQLGDGSHLKSKQINFDMLYSIFNEYSSKKK